MPHVCFLGNIYKEGISSLLICLHRGAVKIWCEYKSSYGEIASSEMFLLTAVMNA